MDLRSVHAFSDELVKISSAVDPEALAALRKKLKPGDILVAGVRSGGIEALSGKMLSAFQEGTPYFHSALYAGNGKIVDARLGKGVHHTDLDTFADRYALRALRVDASPAEKSDAVAYARKQVGKDYNLLGTLLQALPARKGDGPRKRERVDALYCSQLISNAYHTVSLAKARHIGDVRPVDLQKSTNTKIIGELR